MGQDMAMPDEVAGTVEGHGDFQAFARTDPDGVLLAHILGPQVLDAVNIGAGVEQRAEIVVVLRLSVENHAVAVGIAGSGCFGQRIAA